MCLIFTSTKGNVPSKSSFRTAFENNPDGVGFMWSDGKKVKTIRGLLDCEDAWNLLNLIKIWPYACHLRFRTRGPISNKSCHPFKIRSPKDNQNVYMMHNGTFFFLNSVKGKSDSQVFAEKLSGVVADTGSHILFSEKVSENIKKKIKSYNKIVFMRDDGEINIINDDQGFYERGIWYSNNYSFQVNYRKEEKNKNSKKKNNKEDSSLTAPSNPSNMRVIKRINDNGLKTYQEIYPWKQKTVFNEFYGSEMASSFDDDEADGNSNEPFGYGDYLSQYGHIEEIDVEPISDDFSEDDFPPSPYYKE